MERDGKPCIFSVIFVSEYVDGIGKDYDYISSNILKQPKEVGQ